jgi:hypothetical protein
MYAVQKFSLLPGGVPRFTRGGVVNYFKFIFQPPPPDSAALHQRTPPTGGEMFLV